MKKKILFLGTGGSVGVPMIGCTCAVCRSCDPFNQRLRPSVLIELEHARFLIDVGPDFRCQALRFGITALDGILLTHAHYDHTAGIDDLRPLFFRRKSSLPVLLSHETAQDLQIRYNYLFRPKSEHENKPPPFQLQLLPREPTGEVFFEGFSFQYVTYIQAGMLVHGYRIGDLAYLSDIRQFSPDLFEWLKGTKYLIISALRHNPSPLHFSVDEAVDFGKKLGVEKVWLTHISHDLDHHQTNAYLPANMSLAYDGCEIEFE